MKKISFLGLEMSGREQGKGRLQKHHPGCKITLTSVLILWSMAMKRSTPLTRNIGAKVKYYRKLRGLSQKQLAAQLQTNGCDITETMLGHIETGYRSTSIFEYRQAGRALKVDYNALFAQD